MRKDKALKWKLRGGEEAVTPRWKRPLQRVAARSSTPTKSKLAKLPWGRKDQPEHGRFRAKLEAAQRHRGDPRLAASGRWARGAAAVGVATAGVVVLARRRRRSPADPIDASESTPEGVDEEPSGTSTAPNAQASRASGEEGTET